MTNHLTPDAFAGPALSDASWELPEAADLGPGPPGPMDFPRSLGKKRVNDLTWRWLAGISTKNVFFSLEL